MSNSFLGPDYFEKLKTYHPESLQEQNGFVSYMNEINDYVRTSTNNDSSFRFNRINQRSYLAALNPTQLSRLNFKNNISTTHSYRGLLLMKNPFDLLLYGKLIEELSPKTIIEFGSLQGGSAIWFADQLKLNNLDGEVHSFEYYDKAIHDHAKNYEKVTFHKVDLNSVNNLDKDFLRSLPHPWLISEDSHTNLKNLIPFMSDLMTRGDYLILEDIFTLTSFLTADQIAAYTSVIDQANLIVDTKYTDAFGYNVTMAPNGWLKKI